MVNIDSLIGSEHQGIDREMLACFYTAALSEGGTVDEVNLRAIRAVIARWSSQQPLRPIHVTERLPGPEDCLPWPDEPNVDPWCWLGSNVDGDWGWEQRSAKSLSYHNEFTHWLPAHALPLPEEKQ